MEYSDLGYIMPSPSDTSNLLYTQDLMGFMSEEPLDFNMINSVTPENSSNLYSFSSSMNNLNDTLSQIQLDKQVSTLKQVEDIIINKPQIDSGSASDSYYSKLAKVESNGNYKAYNKGSGATGRYQFLKSTAEPILKKMGKSWEDFKQTPSVQDEVVKKFTESNAKYLKNNNIPVNDETLWWAHNQGAGGAKALYTGGEISSRKLKSNGAPTGTAAEYIERWRPTFE